ncbi:MAG: NAD(+)/NADH kinase [Proteobacteria bacterium]|nr:NAD(+)/NADH kinase [Pseudomonadota bacterium]
MKIVIVPKKTLRAQSYAQEFCEWLRKKNASVEIFKDSFSVSDVNGSNFVVVIGGDGTLLHTARTIKGSNIPIIGINMGGLGFLTELSPDDAFKAFEEYYLKGIFHVSLRMMLQVVVFREGKEIKSDSVLNDCVINKGDLARIIELNTFVNDEFLYSLRADGLIVSTPTGSTAYVLSAGGPILTPELRCMILCPICPHTLTNRPIVISNDSEIKAVIMSETDLFLTLDGQEGIKLQKEDVIVIKEAGIFTSIVKSPFKSYFEILRTKLHWGIR